MKPIRSTPTAPAPAPSSRESSAGSSSLPGRRTALVAGSVALGALLTGALLRRLRRRGLEAAQSVPLALDAETGELELMEGRVRFYRRAGEGVPIVLLHSINAAASSFEMQPFFEHFARRTTRPVFAMDWLGFGRSERPPVRYTPALYERQLRRFLSEHVHEPSDLVALSLGSEFAAAVAHTLPYLVRRLVLVCPTGLSRTEGGTDLRTATIRLTDAAGFFELFFDRLTRPDSLRRFYQRQVFRDTERVPEALIRYACATSQVHGAHHAPRFFVEGTLFSHASARHAYANLRLPTLILTPEAPQGLVQDFELLPDVLARNPAYLRPATVPAGLLPQWEAPDATFELTNDFLLAERTPAEAFVR